MRMSRRNILAAMLVAAVSSADRPADAQPASGGSGNPPLQQTAAAAPSSTGQVDFGLRGTFFGDGSDEARYQRYRDLRSGPFVDRFTFTRDAERWQLNLGANKVGYRDQELRGDISRPGKLQAAFSWNQIPLFFSRDTQTLYRTASTGVLAIPDEIQSGVQNRTLTLGTVAPLASAFDLRLRRNIADFRVRYTVSRDVDLNLSVRDTAKKGEQPWAGTFGFSDAVELPVPVDTHTTDIGAAAEWNNERATVRLGYDGSFFRNAVDTLTWDNPLIAVDSPTAGSSRGRMALWPDSSVNGGNILGSVALPWRSRATAYLSLGRWSQNQALIPFTINSALPNPPLDRPTADARANVTAMNYTFNTRPTEMLWVSARYRQYKFDNRTPVFHVNQTVTYDQTVTTFPLGGTEPFGSNRKTFDAEASLSPWTFAAFRVGYTREDIARTFRLFESTADDVVRASIDATPVSRLTVRGVYEHGNRRGSGLDEEALDTIGEQVSLRQFDISDRASDRFSAIVQAIVTPSLAFNAQASAGREDRPQSQFGLRSNDNRGVGFGVDYTPRDTVSLGLSYQFDKYTALQRSRQANPGPQFDDPTRDWTTDSDDTVHTVSASADFLKLLPRTDIRVMYDASRGESTYIYGVVPGSTLAQPAQLPPVLNRFHRATVDAQYRVTRHWAAGAMYWYDHYDVNDYAFNPATLDTIAQPAFLALRYVFKPYTANTASARVTYLW
jgi:MtrB/PioB family decaheme-associated outer membrane protein